MSNRSDVDPGGAPMKPASLSPAIEVPDPEPGRPVDGPAEAADDDALLRLAVWLADVAAEAALAAQAVDTNATPGRSAPGRPTEAARPSGPESVR